MPTAPLKWPVQVVAWLPEALRPGAFAALIVLIVWFVFVRRGLPDLWHAAIRGGARLVDALVGATLLPEFAMTSARRRRGRPPAQWALVLGGVTDAVLDGAASLYERHERPRQRDPSEQHQPDEQPESSESSERPKPPARPRKAVPWKACLVLVIVLTGAWIAMDRMSNTSIAKYRLAQAFGPWRDVETWANVDSGRGELPRLVRVRRHHSVMTVRIHCDGSDSCRGWLVLRARSRAVVYTRYVETAGGTTSVPLRLTRKQAHVSLGGSLLVEQV